MSILIGIGSASADLLNARPITLGSSPEQQLGGAGGIFATIGAATYAADPVTTQSDVAVFTNEGSGGAVASFIISIAGNAPVNQTKFYNSSGALVPIFQNTSGSQNPLAQATVSFLALVVSQTLGSNNVVVSGTYANLGDVCRILLQEYLGS